MTDNNETPRRTCRAGGARYMSCRRLGDGRKFIALASGRRPLGFYQQSPDLIVSPCPIPYQRKLRVMIAGSGFEPKQEISLQIELGGIPSDISYMLKPPPVPNELGVISSEWIVDVGPWHIQMVPKDRARMGFEP